MKKYILGNWKENKNLKEAKHWLIRLHELWPKVGPSAPSLILLPPDILLIPLFEKIRDLNLPIELGVQNVSVFEDGPQTGEVSARMVEGFAKYALVGHSERRRLFGETSEMVNQKIDLCYRYHLQPIVCLGSPTDLDRLVWRPRERPLFIAYEDPISIGGEKTEDLKKVIEFYRLVRKRLPEGQVKFIYGGSVNEQNALNLLLAREVDGLLVGHHSLEAESLLKILTASN